MRFFSVMAHSSPGNRREAVSVRQRVRLFEEVRRRRVEIRLLREIGVRRTAFNNFSAFSYL
jgi:hypothetical protein